MTEYFKCKQCYIKLPEDRIARHHAQVHSNVSHDVYLDTYFDLSRPLFKCDLCSIKLSVKRLAKHRQRAHPNEDNTFKKYRLPLLQQVVTERIKAAAPLVNTSVIELSSDGDSDCSPNKRKNPKQLVDMAVQCEAAPEPESPEDCVSTEQADKCIGDHCETEDKSVNTETSMESGDKKETKSMDLIDYRMKLRLELDNDGYAEMVLF